MRLVRQVTLVLVVVMAAQEQPTLQVAHLLIMQAVAAVAVMAVLAVQAVLVAAVQVLQQVLMVHLEQLILAVVVAVLVQILLQAVQVAQASSLFLTQAHNEAQVVLLHRRVATPSIHLRRLAHIPHKEHHGTFCKSSRRKSNASYCCRV